MRATVYLGDSFRTKLTVAVVVNSRKELMNLTKEEAQVQLLRYFDYLLLRFLRKRVVSCFHEPSCSARRQNISQLDRIGRRQ